MALRRDAWRAGLGTNYGRPGIARWVLGIAVPTVLHGLNDGIFSWASAQAEWAGS